jgi:PAS domain S-box-containing protein
MPMRRVAEMPGRSSLSIRLKLQGIVMISCAVALSVASVIFTLYDRSSFRRAKESELAQSATMIGFISTAALTFNDARSAREILKVLQANPHITTACLYQNGVGVLATYRRAGLEGRGCPEAKEKAITVDARLMTLFQPVVLNEEVIGTIYLEADMDDARQRLLRFVAVDFVVSLVSLGIAYLLAIRLQRVISRPIRELGETASAVTARENYSLRAVKHSDDEIGLLFDQFNGMLERIQQRDEAVQKAHDDLEDRVAERTAFLNALVENTPLAVMVMDTERKLQLCNPAFEQMFQYPKAEILGKGIDEVLIPEALVEEAQRAAGTTLRGMPVTMITQRRRRDGSMVEVEGHGVPLVVNGKVLGSLVLYQMG